MTVTFPLPTTFGIWEQPWRSHDDKQRHWLDSLRRAALEAPVVEAGPRNVRWTWEVVVESQWTYLDGWQDPSPQRAALRALNLLETSLYIANGHRRWPAPLRLTVSEVRPRRQSRTSSVRPAGLLPAVMTAARSSPKEV